MRSAIVAGGPPMSVGGSSAGSQGAALLHNKVAATASAALRVQTAPVARLSARYIARVAIWPKLYPPRVV